MNCKNFNNINGVCMESYGKSQKCRYPKASTRNKCVDFRSDTPWCKHLDSGKCTLVDTKSNAIRCDSGGNCAQSDNMIAKGKGEGGVFCPSYSVKL